MTGTKDTRITNVKLDDFKKGWTILFCVRWLREQLRMRIKYILLPRRNAKRPDERIAQLLWRKRSTCQILASFGSSLLTVHVQIHCPSGSPPKWYDLRLNKTTSDLPTIVRASLWHGRQKRQQSEVRQPIYDRPSSTRQGFLKTVHKRGA